MNTIAKVVTYTMNDPEPVRVRTRYTRTRLHCPGCGRRGTWTADGFTHVCGFCRTVTAFNGAPCRADHGSPDDQIAERLSGRQRRCG